MSLKISEINYVNFRAYKKLHIDINSPLIIFYGPNACGKTNIIEGLQLLTYGDSFKNPKVEELILWGQNNASIQTCFKEESRKIKHLLTFEKGKRSYIVNGKRKSKQNFQENCLSVLFIPDDLQMIKTSSQARRNALDILGASLSKNYSKLKKEYTQTIKQKNLLLKEEITSGALFDSWNDNVLAIGSQLLLNRLKLFKRVQTNFIKIFQELSNEKIDLIYLPSWSRFDSSARQKNDPIEIKDEFLEINKYENVKSIQDKMIKSLAFIHESEVARKQSLIGPHKDDIVFFLNGHNARMFASQGQQRTLVLAWKLAEMLTIQEIKNQKPILLLDDVMSELDKNHQNDLVKYLICAAQTFITTTSLEHFPNDLLKEAQVIYVPDLYSLSE